MVNNKAELTSELLDILKNDERRTQMGAASLQVIKENRGADIRAKIYYLKRIIGFNFCSLHVNMLLIRLTLVI